MRLHRISKIGDAIGDYDERQPKTISERLVPETNNTIGDRDARKFRFESERMFPHHRHWQPFNLIGYHHVAPRTGVTRDRFAVAGEGRASRSRARTEPAAFPVSERLRALIRGLK